MTDPNELVHRLALRDELAELGAWISELCASSEQQCLHSFSGQPVDSLVAQLCKDWDAGELVYILARDETGILAAMGCEYDLELGRGWLHGPHSVVEPWHVVGSGLFESVRRLLPASITTFDAHISADNKRASEFYRKLGFVAPHGPALGFGLAASHDLHDLPKADRCPALEKGHEAGFLELYQQLFPASYYSGQRLLSMHGSSHQINVATADDAVVGFVVSHADPAAAAGEVEFLGVREDRRRQGLGRALLLTGVAWLRERAASAEICLNVAEARAEARQLYESVGFELRYTGLGLRLEPSS